MQEFEGYIVEVSSDNFIAMLLDITNNKKVEDEEIELPKSSVANMDIEKIKIGAFFRLTIGYEKNNPKKRIIFI